MNAQTLTLQLKLWALKAIPAVEARAIEWFNQNGEKIIGVEKRKQAVEEIMKAYRVASVGIPGLSLTTIDDEIVRAAAVKALDWAWEEIGEIINEASAAPVVDDAGLGKGGLL